MEAGLSYLPLFLGLIKPFLSWHVDLEEERFGSSGLEKTHLNYLVLKQNTWNLLKGCFKFLRNILPFLSTIHILGCLELYHLFQQNQNQNKQKNPK